MTVVPNEDAEHSQRRQSLGRLVMPALRWNAGDGFAHAEPLIDAALAAGVGGFIIFGGTAEDVAALTERLGRLARRPLLIGADMERGAGQQVAGLPEMPPPLALASLSDPSAIWDAGRLTAEAAQSVGINWIFAPVADLDLESENPIVQTRSFGADPAAAGRAVGQWIGGAHAGGAMACAKHFPGHGRTRHDSHDRTPTVAASALDLETADEVPFRSAIEAGVDAIMTCHVSFPALDPSGAPATRSAPILARLRDRLGFSGLIVSDALNMEGFAGGLGFEGAAVAAVRAGVDILLYPPDPVAAVAALERAAQDDSALAARLVDALGRQAHAARTALTSSVDAAVASGIAGMAERAARMARQLVDAGGPSVRPREPVELIVADDDQDGAYPASPNDWFEHRLRARGVEFGSGGSRVLVAFAEPRASKGRGGFGSRCRALLAEGAVGADLAVLFGHPRLSADLPAGTPVLVGWHRQRLMQEAAADWFVERMR